MVYLIADNIISSLGFTSRENFEALKNGSCGIKIIDDINLYPEQFPAAAIDVNTLEASFKKVGASDQFTRLEKMMILSIKDALSQTSVDITSKRTGIILSTTKGNIDLLQEGQDPAFDKERLLLWKLGETIGNYFENPNQTIVLSNACISGVLAINTAAMLINTGKYDHVIVAGGDLVSKFVVSGFMSFMSLSPSACKPFDINRDGLSLGEAAGTIILSKEKRKGQNIKFLGGASANDANHISGPSRNGEGSYLSIKGAFSEAGVTAIDIDHISAHGTATPYNDEMESISINRHNMESVPVNSIKGYWGHTLGAAGIVETAVLLHEMKNNLLIKTAGFEESGVSNSLNILKENQQKEINTCLKMASGFGGSNAALILQKV